MPDPSPAFPPDVLVVGAGIVGLCCALALQRRGRRVALLDREAPAQHASRWNAGVWATSSLVPLANPATPRRLPGLLLGRSAGFRLDWRVGPALLPWGLRFLRSCRPAAFSRGAAALDALIRSSRAAHEALLSEAGAGHLRRARGWLHLHRTPEALAGARALAPLYDRHGVRAETLDADALAEAEPSLAGLYAGALLFPDTAAIIDPAALNAAYLALFLRRGGTVLRAEARTLARDGDAWRVDLADGSGRARDVVVAAGPWSAALLRTAGLRLPLLAERGTMRRFALRPGAALGRPVFDAAAGIVLSPRPGGVQVSTGTLLTRPGSGAGPRQWPAAARAARAVLPLAEALDDGPVSADRPTLPDCLPAIGPARPGLWLCCGHQHVGFSTSAGSGETLARMVCAEPPEAPLAPHLEAFAPRRFAGMT